LLKGAAVGVTAL